MWPRAWLTSIAVSLHLVSCAPRTTSEIPATSGATVAPSEPRTEPHASEPAVPTDERAASPEPEQPSGFASLDVPGFLPAVVWLPKSSEKSRLFVATHGAGGSPEEHCRFWQQILQNSAIILCLR